MLGLNILLSFKHIIMGFVVKCSTTYQVLVCVCKMCHNDSGITITGSL